MLLPSFLGLCAAATTIACDCQTATPSSQSASPASTLLYVASYAGTLTTLNLTSDRDGKPSLQPVAASNVPGASWLTLDHPNGNLYALEEIPPPGVKNSTLFRFKTNPNGILTLDGVATDVPAGAVSSVLYGDGGLAIASYGSGGFSTYDLQNKPPNQLSSDIFHLDHPGPNQDRQEASHPHQALIDPTGDFLLVPDLGADLVRVWSIDAGSLELTPAPSLKAAPGSGPRHGAFLRTGKNIWFYLIAELANTVTVYDVSYNYNDMTLGFTVVSRTGTHGDDEGVPTGAAAGEITLSPDNRFLLLSSRLENTEPSDPIITFSINAETGELTHQGNTTTGGRTPRHFSLNKDGDLVAVGLQDSGRVVLFKRDARTGRIDDTPYAVADGLGGVSAVIFDD